jgi:hypothetical protein
LAFTALVRGSEGGPNHLVYLSSSDVDAVGGPFYGLVRWVIARRARGEATEVPRGLRSPLGSVPPSP